MNTALKQSIRHLMRLKHYHALIDPTSPEAEETRLEIEEAEDEVQHLLHGHTDVSLSCYQRYTALP